MFTFPKVSFTFFRVSHLLKRPQLLNILRIEDFSLRSVFSPSPTDRPDDLNCPPATAEEQKRTEADPPLLLKQEVTDVKDSHSPIINLYSIHYNQNEGVNAFWTILLIRGERKR